MSDRVFFWLLLRFTPAVPVRDRELYVMQLNRNLVPPEFQPTEASSAASLVCMYIRTKKKAQVQKTPEVTFKYHGSLCFRKHCDLQLFDPKEQQTESLRLPRSPTIFSLRLISLPEMGEVNGGRGKVRVEARANICLSRETGIFLLSV